MTTRKERPAAKGYRYGISAFLALYLLQQSIRARYDGEHWQMDIMPPPVESSVPVITLAFGLLFPQTTKIAYKLGKALAQDEDED